MSAGWIILIVAAAWIAVIAAVRFAVAPWLSRGPRGEPIAGLIWRIVRLYSRVVHRVQFEGMEQLRDQVHPGSLIVVSNHTGSVDPLLIQSGCRFYIRWMMASEMMTPWLNFIWRRERPIPVDRDGRDTSAAREAIRHVQAGGVIGIFPEGGIVWPPEQIRPFFTGVGLIVARAKAQVLLIWISGTPRTRDMRRSLLTRSKARVVFLELIDFQNQRDAHEISHLLRQRLSDVSGWPLNDQDLPEGEDSPQIEWSKGDE